MAEPFLGEIRLASFDYAPPGWALCNGQLLSIAQNQALFSLLGTTFGGDGRTTFALPDFRGRVPLHEGTQAGGPTYALGQRGGETSHTLTTAELPAHTHLMAAASAATSVLPGGNVLAGAPAYVTTAPDTTMSAASVSSVGGGQPHDNLPPYLTLNFMIALQGIFPSQN